MLEVRCGVVIFPQCSGHQLQLALSEFIRSYVSEITLVSCQLCPLRTAWPIGNHRDPCWAGSLIATPAPLPIIIITSISLLLINVVLASAFLGSPSSPLRILGAPGYWQHLLLSILSYREQQLPQSFKRTRVVPLSRPCLFAS